MLAVRTPRRMGGRVPLQTGRWGETLQGEPASAPRGRAQQRPPAGEREGGRGRVLRGERGNEGKGLTCAQTEWGRVRRRGREPRQGEQCPQRGGSDSELGHLPSELHRVNASADF